jgi:hypothetical protein
MIGIPSGSIYGTCRLKRMDDLDLKVGAFPAVLFWPKNSEALVGRSQTYVTNPELRVCHRR